MKRAGGSANGAARATAVLGHATGAGDMGQAEQTLAAAITTLHEVGYEQSLPEALRGIARLAAQRGDVAAAARLDEAADALRAALGDTAFAAWVTGQAGLRDGTVLEALIGVDGSAPPNLLPDTRRVPRRLTAREREVLRLLIERRSDKEIGAALGISHRTAMEHVAHILAKLGVSSRAAAAAYAVEHGLD